MVKFDLIRHAKTLWNLEKKLQGQSDIALAPEGVAQSRVWGKMLAPKKYDLILSSPMIRARKTSQIIAKIICASVEYDENLREQDFGEWEGSKINDIRRMSPGEIERQESNGWAFCPPGGEARSQVLHRVSGALGKAADRFENRRILIVCHSSVIKVVLYKILKREFLPGEPKVLKAYHLHELIWDKTLEIEKLNSMKLP